MKQYEFISREPGTRSMFEIRLLWVHFHQIICILLRKRLHARNFHISEYIEKKTIDFSRAKDTLRDINAFSESYPVPYIR